MARPLSPELLSALNAEPDTVGKQLGRFCLANNLPMAYVNELLGVSRMTLHSWFRGSGIRGRHAADVRRLLEFLEQQVEDGGLPAKDQEDGKAFLEELLARKLTLRKPTSAS